ncbi:MAG: translation initiation factor [archaeon]
MQDTCPKCGLPAELCVCETISKEAQKIKVYTIKKRFGKISTVIEGIDEKNIDLRKLTTILKSHLACGGTSKDGKIELQGNHPAKVKEILIKEGFNESTIE